MNIRRTTFAATTGGFRDSKQLDGVSFFDVATLESMFVLPSLRDNPTQPNPTQDGIRVKNGRREQVGSARLVSYSKRNVRPGRPDTGPADRKLVANQSRAASLS